MSVNLSRGIYSLALIAALPLSLAFTEAVVPQDLVSGSSPVDSPGQDADASVMGLDPNDATVPEGEVNAATRANGGVAPAANVNRPGGKGRTGAGMGVGYPGHRGQGVDEAPHHRHYGSPPRAADE